MTKSKRKFNWKYWGIRIMIILIIVSILIYCIIDRDNVKLGFIAILEWV